MLIPNDAEEREALYDEVVQQCERSQEDRRAAYEKFRAYYLYGSENPEEEVPFNKIYPHLDTVVSFMFASETTKFSVMPEVGQPDVEYWRSAVFGDALNAKWHNSNADLVIASAILWGLVYQSMIVKVLPRVNRETKTLQINPYTVHPAMMGVYREDVPFFDRQQAITQTFYTTKDELYKELEGNPLRDRIMALITTTTNEEEEQGNTAMNRIMMGSWQPVGNPQEASGNISFNLFNDMGYRPEQMDKLVKLKELWIWDDERNEYRTVTRTDKGVISIYDRMNPYLPGEHPFVNFCPRPLPFYVWGESEVGGLVGLQAWRNEYISQLRKILGLNLTPPTTFSGFGAVEETQYASWIQGSALNDSGGMGMNAKAEQFRPTVPADAYRMIQEIDNSFNEYSGLPNSVQGKGDTNVRSEAQASTLARLGSARIKKRSLVIEDAIEKVGYLYARLMQKHSEDTYKDSKGNIFVLNQFTKEFDVKVDAHSSSPVFVEDKRDLAFSLLKANLATPERTLEMIDPPDKQSMLREIQELKAQAAQAQQAKQQEELQKEALKHAPPGFIQQLLTKLFGKMGA